MVDWGDTAVYLFDPPLQLCVSVVAFPVKGTIAIEINGQAIIAVNLGRLRIRIHEDSEFFFTSIENYQVLKKFTSDERYYWS